VSPEAEKELRLLLQSYDAVAGMNRHYCASNGISGNRVLNDWCGILCIGSFRPYVLSQPRVRSLIVYVATPGQSMTRYGDEFRFRSFRKGIRQHLCEPCLPLRYPRSL